VGEAWAPEGILGAEVLTSSTTDAPSALCEQLRTVAVPGLIVLDDFHLTAVPPAEMVGFISDLPASVRLVISSRADPPFSLSRMRLHGTLLELRQADLAFTSAETTEALAALDLPVDDDDIERLHKVTEGWPAGVHLLGISLRDQPERRLDLAGLAADDRNLADFLLNEVVDRQRPEVREFLMATAELASFDPELCDEVMDRSDSAALLDEVRSANLFLVEDTGAAARFRYHHLFHDFLRLRLAAGGPEAARELHRRAGEVFARRGDHAEAVRHYLDAGAVDAARDLLAGQITSALTLDLDGGATVARRWLTEHGDDQLQGDTSGFLECTMALHVGGAVEEAELWLRRWRDREAELDHTTQVLLHGAWSFHHVFVGDPMAALSEARRAGALIEQEPVASRWSDSLLVLDLQALVWLGDHESVRRVVASALERPSLPPALALVRLPAAHAQADLAAGELQAAHAEATRALRSADDLGLPDLHFGRAEPELILAALDLERDDLDEATDRLERVMRIVEQRRPPIEVLAHLTLAAVAEARGDPVAAEQCIGRARAAQPRASQVVTARIDEAAARVALRRGDGTGARELIERLPAGSIAHVLAARLALAQDDTTTALDHLGRLDPTGADRRSRIEQGVLRALATSRTDRDRATRGLAATLELSRPEGFHRTLVAEGPPLWDLLEALPAHGHTADHVGQLLATARRTVPATLAVDQGSLIDPLSERELTVLRYLASRLDSSEIAAALYLSVNTVRTHVKAIYRKLAVSSRADAVARARDLGLL
jgi:LuxR family maltose regulon positive regulatory protein